MITPKRVNELQDAQIVRMIRNELRQNMTNNNAFIDDDVQKRWFEGLKDDVELTLYYNENSAPIGFSFLRVKDSTFMWGTLGVLPEFQGKGYGTEIYKHMLTYGRVALEIFSDNNASLVAALKAGFAIKWIDDKVIYMESKDNEMV